MIKEIKNNDMQEVLEDSLAVVDFSATWCGPCQMLAPVMEEVSNELEGQVEFYGVDVDANSNLAQQYKIMSVPSILVFKKGEKVAQTVGYQDKDALLEFIQQQQ